MNKVVSFFVALGVVAALKTGRHLHTRYTPPAASAAADESPVARDDSDELPRTVRADRSRYAVDPKELARINDAVAAARQARESGVSFAPGKPMVDLSDGPSGRYR